MPDDRPRTPEELLSVQGDILAKAGLDVDRAERRLTKARALLQSMLSMAAEFEGLTDADRTLLVDVRAHLEGDDGDEQDGPGAAADSGGPGAADGERADDDGSPNEETPPEVRAAG